MIKLLTINYELIGGDWVEQGRTNEKITLDDYNSHKSWLPTLKRRRPQTSLLSSLWDLGSPLVQNKTIIEIFGAKESCTYDSKKRVNTITSTSPDGDCKTLKIFEF